MSKKLIHLVTILILSSAGNMSRNSFSSDFDDNSNKQPVPPLVEITTSAAKTYSVEEMDKMLEEARNNRISRNRSFLSLTKEEIELAKKYARKVSGLEGDLMYPHPSNEDCIAHSRSAGSTATEKANSESTRNAGISSFEPAVTATAYNKFLIAYSRAAGIILDY